MVWDPVPFAVGGGAVMQVEALRSLAYQVAGGHEGVTAAGDAAVRSLAVAGGSVRVMPGGVTLLNRGAHATTGGGQAYAIRNPTEEVVPISPTAVGVTRTDLVAVIVEDPQYAGQPAPADVANGPYVKTVVYENVGAGVTSLQEVDPGQTGLALARITLPPATSVVTQALITDLRTVGAPQSLQVTKFLNLGGSAVGLTSAAYVTFPTGASWNIAIPSWAQIVHLEAHVASLRVTNDATDAGDWSGAARITFGSMATQEATLRPAVPGASKTDNYQYLVGDELVVPAADRGVTRTLKVEAKRTAVSSGVALAHDTGSLVLVRVAFYEAANAGVWD